MRGVWRILCRAFKWGEHADFGGKLVEYAFDWRTVLAVSGSGGVAALTAFVEHRPWSEIVVISLAVLVLLLFRPVGFGAVS